MPADGGAVCVDTTENEMVDLLFKPNVGKALRPKF